MIIRYILKFISINAISIPQNKLLIHSFQQFTNMVDRFCCPPPPKSMKYFFELLHLQILLFVSRVTIARDVKFYI